MARLFRYLWAAFTLRPPGFLVAPNLLAVVAVVLLGLLNPGVWLIGAGLELAYLWVVTGNARFRAAVDFATSGEADAVARLDAALAALPKPDQQRHRELRERAGRVLDYVGPDDHPATVADREEALARLLDVHLQLLARRAALRSALADGESSDDLRARHADARRQLGAPGLDAEHRDALQAQVDVLTRRLEGHDQAAGALSRIEVELTRLEDHVELLREQAALDAEGKDVAVGEAVASIDATTEWLREQRRIHGALAAGVEDAIGKLPPVRAAARARQATARR